MDTHGWIDRIIAEIITTKDDIVTDTATISICLPRPTYVKYSRALALTEMLFGELYPEHDIKALLVNIKEKEN